MTATYTCRCGQQHNFAQCFVQERLARCVDHVNNVNKYWRIVHVQTPCTNSNNRDVWLTHSGRWTGGWRDGGAWKHQPNQTAAERAWHAKTARGQYKPANRYGDFDQVPNGYSQLAILDGADRTMRSRARSGAIAGQTVGIVLAQAGLLQQTSTPVATPAAEPKKSKNGVDPLIILGQRMDTLVTQLATSPQLTPELATERAVLLAELSDYKSRLEQVESTLEVATMLMQNKA